MRPSLLALSAFALLPQSAAPVQPQPSVGSKAVVLRDVRVVDGTGQPALEHTTVVVADGKILKLCRGRMACPAPPGATERPDLVGSTVLPGLISAHAHLALLNAQGQFDPAEYTEQNVIAQLQLYPRYGVTTVVSLGVNRDLVWSVRDRQRAGQVGGATLLTVGRGIGVNGGFPPFSAAPDQVDRPTTPEAARAAVDRAASHQADLIKIWVDSNHGKMPEMSDTIVKAVLSEAHAKGLQVAAHVYAQEDARRLVQEGVDILAHSVRDKPVDAAFVDLLRQKGTWYIPTLTVDESFFVYADHPELLEDPGLQAAPPAEQVALLKSQEYRIKVKSDPATAQHRTDFANASHNLKALYDAGVHVGFGTDSGAMLGRIPGYSEQRELQLMVQAGLTPLQVLACATGHNAKLLHLNTGLIQPGRRADLVVVKGAPDRNISDFRQLEAVYEGGVPVQR